jgi:hypothetical protein
MHSAMPSQCLLRQLFDYDPKDGKLYWKRSGKVAGSTDSSGHRQVKIKGVTYQLHRIVWLWWYGDGSLPMCQLDHIDRDRSNNRIENLRLAARNDSDNQQNTSLRKDNTSGIKGVSWIARIRKWEVQIQTDKKKKYVGVYENLLDAVAARLAAEKELFTFLHQ